MPKLDYCNKCERTIWITGKSHVCKPNKNPYERKGKNKPAPCIHLGEPTGREIQCDGCGGKVMSKVFACLIFGECTKNRKITAVAVCSEKCPSYSPSPSR